jgi:hypothetical protein
MLFTEIIITTIMIITVIIIIKSSGPGTGCTQPREYKMRSCLIEK